MWIYRPKTPISCLEAHRNTSFTEPMSGQCKIRDILQKTVRTWAGFLPLPLPRDRAEQAVSLWPGTHISWPWHHPIGDTGPSAGPHVAAAHLAPSLEQEQLEKTPAHFQTCFRMSSTDMPNPCPKTGPSTTICAQSCSSPGDDPIQDCCHPSSPLSFLSPLFFDFPANYWEVFFKGDQVRASYF